MTPTAQQFQEIVWEHYRSHARMMPWRDDPSPYKVLVSELMLQQTQVPRVIVKFDEFMKRFPTVQSLAAAPLGDVLDAWSGLGYNRRAKFLHLAAQQITASSFPNTLEGLVALPGVGLNTAAAIMNYAYNQPHPFVETNIRTVYFEHYFQHSDQVSDKEVLVVVEQTMDHEHPREWFWALMDYGTALKKQGKGRLDQSRHYKKQSPLVGSLREMRGRILVVLRSGKLSVDELKHRVDADERFQSAVEALHQEGLIEQDGSNWCLTGHRGAS